MKKYLFSISFLFLALNLISQTDLESFTRNNDARSTILEDLAPFYHGVASGDPTTEAVIIWTRVTIDNPADSIPVAWFMATDTSFSNIVQQGITHASNEKHYTVKVDVQNLDAGTTYYYAFQVDGINSIAGRTKTAANDADQLRFAVVSCSNYQHGFFNSYGRIAERNDLDAVIHLGDYIYEYGQDSTANRPVLLPEHEILELIDYRTRYSFYRMDEDLRNLHQQHPIICVWDDHEVANDSYFLGAENHNPMTEGNYIERKNKAKQAYFEWMPIRDNNTNSVYRAIEYGDLAEIIMIDTRHESRSQQVSSLDDSELGDSTRTLLGIAQKEWLLNTLDNSDSKWKIIGNQVIFTPLLEDELSAFSEAGALAIIADIWEGYPLERNSIIEHVNQNDIDNIIIMTGDIHNSFAMDIPNEPDSLAGYDPVTGANSAMVEVVTPSITSDNFGDILGIFANALVDIFEETHPHVKLIDVINHGYMVIDLNEDRAQSDWFYDPDRLTSNTTENFGQGWYTNDGTNHLQETDVPAEEKAIQEAPAPSVQPQIDLVGIESKELQNIGSLVFLSVFHNGYSQNCTLNFAVNEPQNIEILITDISGKVIAKKLNHLEAGLFSDQISLPNLGAGIYLVNIRGQYNSNTRKFMVK